MQCFRKVTEDLYWVGGNDRQIDCLKIFSLLPKVSLTTHTFFWMNRQFFLIQPTMRSENNL